MNIRSLRLSLAVTLTLVLQACASAQTDTTGLHLLGERDVGALVTQGATFRSTTESLSYQLQPGGSLQVTNAGSVHAGRWTLRSGRLCVSMPKGGTPDCYQVFRTPNGNYRFRDLGGTVSDPFEHQG